jgi:hypothetical protein
MCRTFLRTEPFPEWILAGFDEIGDRLSRVTAASSLGPKYMLSRYAPPNGHWTKNATYVLFGRAAGRDLLRVHAKWDFDYFLAILMRLKLDAPSPNNESDAIYLVAKEWEVSESKVRRAWKRFQAAARAEDYELQADFAEHLDRPLFEARDRLRRDGINPTPIQEWLYGTYDGAAPSPAQRKSRKTKLVSFQSRNRRK